MSRGEADRNLLFGILALQMEFVSRDALIAGMNAWVLDKSRPLGQVLREQGALAADDQALLEAMVEKHLRRQGEGPGPDPAGGGAVASTGPHPPEPIETVAIPALAQATVGRGPDDPADATLIYAVGLPTAAGLRYRVLRPHARGGLGAVSIAQDLELNREVALKEIDARHAQDPDSRARFVLEAEVTGSLEHPGIVPVYGLGHYPDGRPYYAMRFIKGSSLKEAIEQFHRPDGPAHDPRRRRLALRGLLRRFIDVCNAIAYAHSRGVLHRDLKPANVMLGPYGETLVVDWGLAKPTGHAETLDRLAEATLRPVSASGSAPTVLGSAIGTPQYMSPEQAAGRLDLLGPASDVYSLGATLYCLLTGKPPIDDPDVGEVLRRAQRGDFPPPRQVRRAVPRGLEAICLKAMARDPAARHASPRALAEDIEHWLADEPTSAGVDPLPTRVARWGRRHRPAVAGAVALLMTALVALSISTVLIGRAKREADDQRLRAEDHSAEADRQRRLAAAKSREAVEKAALLERQLYIHRINLAQRETVGDVALAGRLLADCPPALRGWEWSYLERLRHLDLRTLRGHTERALTVAYSPDGRRLVTGSGNPYNQARDSDEPEVIVWDAETGAEVLRLRGLKGQVTGVAYSPDGARIVTGSGYYHPGRGGDLTLWDARTGRMIWQRGVENLLVMHVAFRPDGRSIGAAYGTYSGTLSGRFSLWDADRGEELSRVEGAAGGVNHLAFRPDGTQVALAGSGVVELWDLDGPTKVHDLRGHTSWVYGVAFSPDGRRLASCGWDNTVRIWDPDAGQELRTIDGHDSMVSAVAFCSDGKHLASAGADHVTKIWSTATWRLEFDLHGHTDTLNALAFRPDGLRLATASSDRTVKVWDATRPRQVTVRDHSGWVPALAFRPDGRRVATGSGDRTVKLWDPATGRVERTLEGHLGWVFGVAYSPDGRTIATASEDRTVRLWDDATGAPRATLTGHAGNVRSVAYHPDGTRLASGADDGTIRIWDAATHNELSSIEARQGAVFKVAIRPDGRVLASAGYDGTVKTWDLATGRELRTFRGHDGPVQDVIFSPDGLRLASAGDDRTVRLWEVATGRGRHVLRGHSDLVVCLAFTADGKRLASGSYDRSIRIWDPEGGDEILTLLGHSAGVVALAFGPDGHRLASGSIDWTAKVWDATPVGPE